MMHGNDTDPLKNIEFQFNTLKSKKTNVKEIPVWNFNKRHFLINNLS